MNFKNTTDLPTWNTANGSANFTAGKGYLAAYDAEETKTFSGKLTVADLAVTGLAITNGGNPCNQRIHGSGFLRVGKSYAAGNEHFSTNSLPEDGGCVHLHKLNRAPLPSLFWERPGVG